MLGVHTCPFHVHLADHPGPTTKIPQRYARCLALSNHLCVGSSSSSGEAKPTDKHSDLPTASLTRVPPS